MNPRFVYSPVAICKNTVYNMYYVLRRLNSSVKVLFFIQYLQSCYNVSSSYDSLKTVSLVSYQEPLVRPRLHSIPHISSLAVYASMR